MVKRKYEIGYKIEAPGGQLILLEILNNKKLSKWNCYCGKIFLASNNNVGNGHTKSCGCWKKHLLKNKLKDPNLTYLFRLWSKIKERCYDKNHISFCNYGSRGIIIDPIWENDSKKFVEDILNSLGHRTTEKHQLDRIDNNGNYTIDNLKWSTSQENQCNKRNNVFITINKEIKTISEWSKISNISANTILQRYKKEWSEDNLLKPIKSFNSLQTLTKRWANIKQRCYNENNERYKDYGGRGIKFHGLWKENYKKFEEDIIKEIGLPTINKNQLDRINNNGNYEPGNLRWISAKENSRNKRNNNLITIDNITKTLAEWSELSNIDSRVISTRLKSIWPEYRLLEPINKRKLNKEQVEKISNKYNQENISMQKLANKYSIDIRIIMDIIHKRGAYKN